MSPKLAKIFRILDAQVGAMDLDKGGLGERAMDAAVRSIRAGMDAETDPDGNRWPDLSEGYAKAKARIAPGKPMADLLGMMKDRAQLAGERTIAAHEATMTYGITEAAKAEAEWFHEGDDERNRPPRRFYALSADGLDAQDKLFTRRLERAAKP